MGWYKFSILGIVAIGLVLAGCATEPGSTNDREDLHSDVVTAFKRMSVEDPGFEQFLASADGYVLFPTVGKGAFIVGGSYGHGEVYEKGQFIGYADISQATIGLQAGGQGFSEAIAFQTPDSLALFKAGQLTLAANASAVALKAGAAASAKYDGGLAIFVDPIGGLMVEAAVGGQSFSFQPK